LVYVASKSVRPAGVVGAVLPLRQVLLASFALAFVTGAPMTGLVRPAAAAMLGYYPDPGYNPYYFDPYQPNPIVRPRPLRPAPKSDLDPDQKPRLKAEPAKDFAAVPKGPLQIVVSIANQHVTLYSNGVHVAQSPVSTGVPGRPTPTGVFSIIQKDRFHHSNLYSNAPMPFMERITWSGVALHEGPLPGYPASHGCIRMTHEFAARLWQIARLGVRVIVARNEVVPEDIAHPRLFGPKVKPAEPPVAGDDPDKHAALVAPVHFARVATASSDTPSERAAGGSKVKPVEVAAPDPATAPLGATDTMRGATEGGAPTAAETTATVPAPAAVDEPTTPRATSVVVETAPAPVDLPKPGPDAVDPAKSMPRPTPLKAQDQLVRHTGTVAVFISRKEKKLYVRQGFTPLFDVPVEIEHPEQPLGTHVFTALGLADNGTHMRWNVMSMSAEPPRQQIATKIGSKAHPEARPAQAYLPQTPALALDRIQIPPEAIDRIDEILSPGASLVISDQGLGSETGEGTDFIVLTR
jgi:lipoprotein-anchoring transpeptidase ErfK/SrfK